MRAVVALDEIRWTIENLRSAKRRLIMDAECLQ